MIESVKDKLWDILKQKEVSLAMLFSRDGRILWHKGREVIGKTIEDGEGFSKSSIGATIEKGGHFEKEGAFATLSGSNLPLSAMTLQVKSLIIQQVDPDLFLYIDSGVKESFTTSDRDMFRIIGELLGKTIETIKDRHVGIAGSSQAAGRLRELVLRYSLEEEPVLLIGETGVGKSYVAELIHQFSGRKGRFVIVNCPTIPENLLESEIFGHRKGAFTGADANKKGLLEEADGGTFLLDEIGEVPVTVQAKLLQLLDTRKYRVLGDTKERTADVRIIAATNRDLQEDIETKRFRQDLYYRLNVLPIKIPPLRERKEDIRSIVQENMMLLRGKSIVSGFWEAIMDHAWPGNARELIHVLKRAGIAIEEPAVLVLVWYCRPKSCERWKTRSGPISIAALMAGMFSETRMASRSRTGPRSSRSASVGV